MFYVFKNNEDREIGAYGGGRNLTVQEKCFSCGRLDCTRKVLHRFVGICTAAFDSHNRCSF